MKFSAVMLFSVLWMLVVYFPIAHLMWGDGGLFNGVWNPDAKVKAIDFAGGIVVHITSGWSALILCILLGKRRQFGRIPMPPHSMVLCMAGTGMLWVGWYGFNAGSAVAADRVATTAFVSTTLSAAVGCIVWGAIEWLHRGKPSVLGRRTRHHHAGQRIREPKLGCRHRPFRRPRNMVRMRKTEGNAGLRRRP
jgi:Amt family ammonium transporter